ncbi:MAG: hypothetical protein ACPL1F_00620 [bacterium]
MNIDISQEKRELINVFDKIGVNYLNNLYKLLSFFLFFVIFTMCCIPFLNFLIFFILFPLILIYINIINQIKMYINFKSLFKKLNIPFNYNFIQFVDIPFFIAMLQVITFFFVMFLLLTLESVNNYFDLNNNINNFRIIYEILWSVLGCSFFLFAFIIPGFLYLTGFLINDSLRNKAKVCLILYNLTGNEYFYNAYNSFLQIKPTDYIGKGPRYSKLRLQPYVDLYNAFSTLPDVIYIDPNFYYNQRLY